MNRNHIKQAILDIIEETSEKPNQLLQQSSILTESANRLDIKDNIELEQLLLTEWNDLFRSGYLSWGSNLDNPNPPFFHVSAKHPV